MTTPPDASGSPPTDPSPPPAYPLPPPPLEPSGYRRRSRSLLAVAIVWALVLGGIAVWYSFHGRPTAREQTTIAQARPVVDEAIGNVVRAAGAGTVPAVLGYEKVSDCHVTPIRDGVTYERIVRLYTATGTEPALLDRIAAHLPKAYGAHAYHASAVSADSLTADAGFFVGLTGTVTVPGLVTVKAATGCRTLGRQPAAEPTTGPAADPLGIGGTWRVHELPCGLRTVEVTGPAGRALSTLPRTNAVVATDDVYADRNGRAAYRSGELVTLTETTGTCR